MSTGLPWYVDGHTVSDECQSDGIGCDDCDCLCHSESAPFFATNDDVAKWHKRD